MFVMMTVNLQEHAEAGDLSSVGHQCSVVLQQFWIGFNSCEPARQQAPRIPACVKPGAWWWVCQVWLHINQLSRGRRQWLNSLLRARGSAVPRSYCLCICVFVLLFVCLVRFFARPLAELITSQGREILQSTVDLVQDLGVPGLEVRQQRETRGQGGGGGDWPGRLKRASKAWRCQE